MAVLREGQSFADLLWEQAKAQNDIFIAGAESERATSQSARKLAALIADVQKVLRDLSLPSGRPANQRRFACADLKDALEKAQR